MPQNIIKSLFLFLALLIVNACGTNKKGVEEMNTALPKVKDAVFIERLDSMSKQRPEFFYAKFNSKYKDNNNNVSFKTSIRSRIDSATQVMITYATLPIYNVLITPDTVTLLDKRNHCYIKEGVNYFKNAFSVDFNYRNIEEMILGLPIAWDKKIKYHQVDDPFNYIITSSQKEHVRTLGSKQKNLAIRYYFKEDTKTLEKTVIESPKDSSSITIRYTDYQIINNFNIPTEEKIHIATPNNDIYVDLKYIRTSINDPRILYLSIPNKYEKCEK